MREDQFVAAGPTTLAIAVSGIAVGTIWVGVWAPSVKSGTRRVLDVGCTLRRPPRNGDDIPVIKGREMLDGRLTNDAGRARHEHFVTHREPCNQSIAIHSGVPSEQTCLALPRKVRAERIRP